MKWEYKKAFIGDDVHNKTIEVLNEFGEEGWEFTGYAYDTGYGMEYLMKRQKIAGRDG